MTTRKISLNLLTDGIRQINEEFIVNPKFDSMDYATMIVQYIISAFLISIGQKADDFGFYSSPLNVGYVGWLTIDNQTLFFGPTKLIIVDEPLDGGELSSIGRIE